jgi:hypothetical protein
MFWNGKATLAEIWARLAPVRAQGQQWLSAEREPLTWAALWTKLTALKLPSTFARRFVVLGVIVLLLLLVLPWYAKGRKDEKHVVTYPNAALINPILAGAGALFLIYAAIRQARTAGEQAETARKQAQNLYAGASRRRGSGQPCRASPRPRPVLDSDGDAHGVRA